jgi:hypothetical protein
MQTGNLAIKKKIKQTKKPISIKTGLGNFIMLVCNDLFRHDEVGLGQ